MDDTATYYVRRRGVVDGPWPVSKLRSEVALRKLGKHDEISVDGAIWRRASEMADLFSRTASRKAASFTARGVAASQSSPEAVDDAVEIEVEPAEAPSTRAMSWHCAVGDAHLGSYSTGELIAALDDGRIPPNALVWREGFADWIRISDVPDFARQTASYSDQTFPRRAPQAIARSSSAYYALWIGVGCLLLSWAPLIGFAGLFAVILGCVGIREINASDERMAGAGAAVTGIVLGVLTICIAIVEVAVLGIVFWPRIIGEG